MKNTRWKYLIIILLAIPIVSYIGKTVGEYMAIQQNEQERNYNSQKNLSDGVKAYVAIQDAGAVTEQQMDMNFLKNLELYTAERIKTNINKSLESKGMSVKNLNIQLIRTCF